MPVNEAVRQRIQPLASAFTSNRIMLYAVFSTGAMMAAIANACRNQSNFYSVMVYLSRSGRSLLILANFGFLAALVCGRIMQRIFFGPLQPREVERLYDQTWMFVTESLLAFTIFRDEFDIPFVLMFGFLLFVKCFHWLMADRVESMDQLTFPGPPLLFHIRINSLFLVLTMMDFVMFAFAVESTLTNGVGGMVLFATEYAILMASAFNAMARYSLNNLDYRRARMRGGENAPSWEHKSMYVFYIELVTDFLKLTTYLTFFMIILTYYGLPLNIIRDVYITARSFITRVRALIRYHNATRDMDRRYPSATEEELSAMSDRTCIICREELTARTANDQQPNGAASHADANQDGPNMTPKKLPCGHIFHFQCLRSWLERQQSCPTCRRTVLETNQTNRDGQRQQQQQQAGAARGAVPPQPGAVPQPGQPGQPQPGDGLVPVWMRRLLGVAAQPPLVPGQFPNGFGPGPFPHGFIPQGPPPPGAGLPPQQQFAHNVAWGVPPQMHQLPPGYMPPPPQYYPQLLGQYHPQAPPPYFQYPMQPQQQQLLPPPVLRGFHGPAQNFIQWPADHFLGQRQAQDQAPGTQQQQTQTQPAAQTQPQAQQTQGQPATLSSAAVPAPAAVGQTQSQSSSNEPPSPTISTSSSSSLDTESSSDALAPGGAEGSSSAREAAASAASRRLAAVRPTASDNVISDVQPATTAISSEAATTTATSSEITVTPSGANMPTSQAPAPTPTTQIPAPTPTTSVPANSSAPATTTTAPSVSTSTSPPPAGGNVQYPPLIPVYNFPIPTQNQPIPPYAYSSPVAPIAMRISQRQHPQASGAPPPPPGGFRPGQPPFPQHHSHHHPRQPSSQPPPQTQQHQPQRRLQLPPTLSEEQLNRLDRLTRDAIDERLRVLEGVSGAVYRCIEELTRVRSVLPQHPLAGAPAATGSGGLPTPQAQPPNSASTPMPSSTPIDIPTVDVLESIPSKLNVGSSATAPGVNGPPAINGSSNSAQQGDRPEGSSSAAADEPVQQAPQLALDELN